MLLRTIARSVTGTIPRMPDDRAAALRSGPAARGRPARRRAAALGARRSRPAAPACSSSSCRRRCPAAPIELTRVGKWLERVPGLLLDGARPTSRALAARLGSFWLPSQVVHLHRRDRGDSIGGRVAAMERTVLGDRRPSLRRALAPHAADPALDPGLVGARPTAVEEYEDALFAAFAAAVSEAERAALPDRYAVLPFANLRRPTGERKRDRALRLAAAGARRAARATDAGRRSAGRRRRGRPRRAAAHPPVASAAPTEPPSFTRSHLVARRRWRRVHARDGAAADRAANGHGRAVRPRRSPPRAPNGCAPSSTELTKVKRPEVIARIRAAKELGDLKENADYSSAREEQSFLEGRVQALEARLREAVIAVVPAAGAGADLGSRITVEIDGDDRHVHPGRHGRGGSVGRAGCRSRRRSGGRCWGRTPVTRSPCRRRAARYLPGGHGRVGRVGPSPRSGSRRRPACARRRRARPASATRARACPGCSRRRSAPSAR